MLIYEGTARAAGKPALQDSSIKFYCQGDNMLMNALLTRWALALFTVKGHYAVFGANVQTAVKQQVKLCSNKPLIQLRMSFFTGVFPFYKPKYWGPKWWSDHLMQTVGMSLQLADNLSLTVFEIPQTTTTPTSKLAAC